MSVPLQGESIIGLAWVARLLYLFFCQTWRYCCPLMDKYVFASTCLMRLVLVSLSRCPAVLPVRFRCIQTDLLIALSLAGRINLRAMGSPGSSISSIRDRRGERGKSMPTSGSRAYGSDGRSSLSNRTSPRTSQSPDAKRSSMSFGDFVAARWVRSCWEREAFDGKQLGRLRCRKS